MNIEITNETPIAMLTVGQLKAVIIETVERINESNRTERASHDTTCRYVYGLSGIAKLFDVSTVTAHRMKNGVLKGAIYQQGRTIVCDVDKALKLFAEK